MSPSVDSVSASTHYPPPTFIFTGIPDSNSGGDGRHDPQPGTRTDPTPTPAPTPVSASTSPFDTPPDTPSPYSGNPFSPPASVRSFSVIDSIAPPTSGDSSPRTHSPFPDRPDISRSVISSQLSTASSYVPSRPVSRHGAEHGRNISSRQAHREPFTPPPARPITAYGTALPMKSKPVRPKSTLLSDTASLSKPWLEGKKDPHVRISYLITYGVTFLGVLASALRIYFGYKGIPQLKGNLCPVLNEDFSDGEESVFGDTGKFFREVDMSGFGCVSSLPPTVTLLDICLVFRNGEFEMTTSSSNNSFVKDGRLYILPTLTSDVIGSSNVFNGYTFNLTDCTYNATQYSAYTSSMCTSMTPCVEVGAFSEAGGVTDNFDAEAYYHACSAVSNSTTGAIINPVQSARLTTRNSASIKFGKVEVVAKLPTGSVPFSRSLSHPVH